MTNARPQDDTPRERWRAQYRQQRIDVRRQAAPPGRGRAVLSLAYAAVAVAVAAVLIALWPGAAFAYDAGLAGKAGTFTASDCWTTGNGKGTSHHCEGTFSATDGSLTVPHVILTNTHAALGRPLAVRHRADGGYAVPTISAQLFDLAVCVLLAAMAGGAVGMIGDAPRKRMGQRELLRRQPWLALAYTGILTFPLGILLAVLLAVAAFFAGVSGH